MIGMNIHVEGHVFNADTPEQLYRLLHLLSVGSLRLAVFFYGVGVR